MISESQTYVTVMTEKRELDGNIYQYRLLSRKDKEEEYYSISAEMICGGEETSSMVYDVFRSFDKARAFFARIVAYLATPINLPYVVEDEITEGD